MQRQFIFAHFVMIFINVVNERLSFDVGFLLLQIDLLESGKSIG